MSWFIVISSWHSWEHSLPALIAMHHQQPGMNIARPRNIQVWLVKPFLVSCWVESDQLVEEMHLYVAVECHLTRVRIMQSKEGNQRKICRLQLRRNFFPVSACSWGCAASLHWWWLYSGASSGVFIHWLLMCCMTWLILTSSARICWGVQLTLLYDDATTASYILYQLK